MRLRILKATICAWFVCFFVFCHAAAAQGPTITSITPASGPIGSTVTITGQNFGSTQGSSTVSLGTTSAPVMSWSGGSISVIVPTGATSGTFSVTVSGQTANSSAFTLTSLPSGWTDADIGSVGVAGSASYGNGVFTISGSGLGFTSGTTDGMNFLYQPLSGDGTIIARVVQVQGSGQAGVMIRETLNSNASDISTTHEGSNVYLFDRTSTGASTAQRSSESGLTPYWVEVVRSGSSFSSYASPDGINWTQIGTTQTITMAENVYVGLVVSSGSNTSADSATFDNVSVSPVSSPAPSITSLSATTGPAGSQISISGSTFGSSQGSGVVTLNASPIPVSSWSNTTIFVTIPTGATSGPILVATSPSLNASNYLNFGVTNQPLPTGWLDQDVGPTGATGIATYTSGVFTVSGGGAGFTSGTTDAFHFAYQPLSGDGSIIARVVTVQGSAQAGVMIRETLGDGATDASTTRQSSNIYFFDRSSTGASTSQRASSSSTLPYWIEVVRSGNTFSSYMAPDGVNWTQLGSSQTITMAQNVYVGLAVSSQITGTLDSVTFDNVSINSASDPAPVITSLTATTGSVGSQVIINGSGFGASGTVTLNGTPVTINEWSATGIAITIPSGATSGPIVVSAAPSMIDSNYVNFSVTTEPLPSTWMDQDVGVTGLIGSSMYLNGTFTVDGAGYGTTGSADGFHFVYQPLSGDGTIIARVVSTSGSGVQAGVMIRQALDAGSQFAYTFYNNQMKFYYRTTYGSSYSSQGTASIPGLPYWVELVRSGSTFTAYISENGLFWTQLESAETISMSGTVYVGLAVSSNSTSSLGTATFDSVSISTTANPAPAIASASATTGSIGSQVQLTGTGFGAAGSGSVVLLNSLPMIIDSWSDTSIIATVPSAAVSGAIEVAVAPTMNASNPVDFTVTSQVLPIPWLDEDVGSVGAPGSAGYASGVFTVQAAGSGIGGTSDSMHFVFQPLAGDGSIVARVVSLTGGASADAGVMIRETLGPGATNGFVSYENYLYFTYRTTTGGSTASSGNASGSLPYWVKLVRSGNSFSAYISPDGVTWTQRDSTRTITMAQNVYVGLAVTNSLGTTLSTATFDNVSVTIGTTPIVTGVSPALGGISSTVTIAGSNFGTATGTVSFNGVNATSIGSWSNSQIVATVPAGASTGIVNVTANSIQGISNQSFTVINPVITSITPPAAEVGGQITINGVGFGSYINSFADQVSFNGVAVSAVPWSDTSITVNIPSGTTSGSLAVIEDGVASNSIPFTVTEPIGIATINPTAGAVGTAVTISGTGFGSTQSDSAVTFNGTAAAVSSWSDTSITVAVPAGASTGPVTVEVADITANGPFFQVTTSILLTDSLGNQTTYSSEIAGGKWYVSSSQGSGCTTCTLRGAVESQFDIFGNVQSTTDELGRTTSFAYDSNDDLITVTQPPVSGGVPQTTYTYNNFGEPLTVTDPLGHVTTNTYDAHGNLLTVTAPTPGAGATASVTQFGYNSLGEMTQITDPLGHITTLTYTSTGLVNTITDAQSSVTTYAYDVRGNRISIADPLSHVTTFAYDLGNRLTTITYPDTTTTTFGYDYRGRRTSVTDQNGKTTSYAYDDADRLVSVTDANSNVTNFAYDTENNLLSIRDANGNTTSFAYDAYGRVIETTFPSTHYEQYAYDAANNLTSKTDRNGNTIEYIYDGLNRLTQKNYPDSTNVEYVYDLAGKLLQVTDPTGTYGLAYDNMGRLVGSTTQYASLSGTTFTNSYSYDAQSNRSSFTDPQGGVTTFSYDTLNRLASLTPPSAFGGGAFGFSYDALSRRTQMTRPNGIVTNYTYDNLSQLLSILHEVGTSTIDGSVYTLDAAGNMTANANQLTSVTSTYTYDPLYELTRATQGSATTESYAYDAVGNRMNSLGVGSYSYNASNEMTSNSNASFTFDANGNTTSKTVSGSTTTYSWNFENRLTQVVVPGSSGGTTTFSYDPFGRRIRKSGPLGTTIYSYDGPNEVEELDNTGSVVARYIQANGVDKPLSELRAGAASFYEADEIGSVTSLTSSSGAIQKTYNYDSFGNLTASAGTLANPFQYTGREFDSETSLYYYRARYFDSSDGRFLSEDPNRLLGGINYYSYVKNSSLNDTDPFGLAGSHPHKLDSAWNQARLLLSDPNCAQFLKDVFTSLGDTPDLNNFLKNFDNTTFGFTPPNDPFFGADDYIAHVDQLGSEVVHVHPNPRASCCRVAVTLLHEVLHSSLAYVFNDQELAATVGYKGPPTIKGASRYFSGVMEAHCVGGCQK